MTSYSFSSKQSLLSRLERQGSPLDAPWHVVLPDLSIRIQNVFLKNDFQSLREVVEAFDCGEEWMLRFKNFGKSSWNELKQTLEKLAADGPPEITDYAEEEACAPTEPIVEQYLECSLCSRLEHQGVTLDQPWDEILVVLSVRARNALTNSNLLSISDVAQAIDFGSHDLLRVKNCGRKSIREIKEALETIATSGLDVYLYGQEGAPPANFDQLTQCVLESLAPQDRRLIVRRIFDGLTLEQLGQEYDLTRERIRQKIQKQLTMLNQRFGTSACELTASIVVATESAGGLIHRDALERIIAESDLRRILLGLLIAKQDTYRIWRNDYLTNLASDPLNQKLRALRRKLWERPNTELAIEEIEVIALQQAGLNLKQTPLIEELITEWGGKLLENGRVAVGRFKVSNQFIKLLQSESKAMHISELTDLYLARASKETLFDEDAESDSRAPESSRKALEHRIQSAITREEDVYLCGVGTYIHSSVLEVTPDELDEIADWCVKHIEGETGPVSTSFLLRQLEAAGRSNPALNKYILKDALSRHPDIVSLRKLAVGHVVSFQEHGLTLQGRVEAILRESNRPLTAEDVIHLLPTGIEYFPVGISMCLLKSSFAINLGDGRFYHADSVGLNKAQRQALVEKIMQLLPEGGAPVSTIMLLRQLRQTDLLSGLGSMPDAPAFLWGLLRLDERIQCGTGYLVARNSGENNQSLMEEMIVHTVKNLGVAFPRDIRREMINMHGYRGADATLSMCIYRCWVRGTLRRLPGSLYCPAAMDDETLLEALERQDNKLRRLLDFSDLPDFASEDLWLLTRYFYGQNRFSQAGKLLEMVLERGDCSEELRRSVLRLRSVIWSKMEDN